MREYGMTNKERTTHTFKGQMSVLLEVWNVVDMITLPISLVSAGGKFIGKEVAKEVGEELGEKAVKEVAEETIEKTVKREAAEGAIKKTVKTEVSEGVTETTAKKEMVDTVEDLSQKTMNKDDVLEDGHNIKRRNNSIPPNIDSRLDSLLADIRKDVGKDFPTGNAGAAITDIAGVTNELRAYSKYNNSIDSSKLNHKYSYNFGKNNRIFDTQAVNSDNIVNGPNAFNRAVDSESKILEDIAHQLGYNKFTVDETIKGNVYLITERAPCPSCIGVIKQFEKMFPNVTVYVKYKY